MTKQEQVELRIREVLATEGHAVSLSNKLFRPDGLFNELAKTEDERRIVAQSPLFKQAQKRLMELQQKEAGEFVEAVKQTEAAMPEGSYLLKLESADKT
jgi:hypothetical protein